MVAHDQELTMFVLDIMASKCSLIIIVIVSSTVPEDIMLVDDSNG